MKPKEELLSGDIIVFSASSENQTALPYRSKQHGMFTYFLLQKLHETQADLSYDELAEYLMEKVAVKSALVNMQEQTPNVRTGIAARDQWQTWRFVRD